MKIYVVYDSENGHTEALAGAIAEGARTVSGAEVFLNHVKDAKVDNLAEMDAIIWGCPGYFGTISARLKGWIDGLVGHWSRGELIGKAGAVFCTTASVHGGIETTMVNLIIPMLHQGMIVVGLPGNIPENALYGSFYGVGVTCPVETDAEGAPFTLSEYNIALGRGLGQRVAEVAGKLIK